MKYQYITIEREFGSGGTRIGELLAKECKMPCYGREILECVARKYDISVEQIEQYEEGVTNSFLYTVFVMSKAQSGDMNMLSDEGKVYLAEQAAIQSLAHNGSAVFMGHCASEALKDRKGVVKVFIRMMLSSRRESRRIIRFLQTGWSLSARNMTKRGPTITEPIP